jgi:TPR repeat protein
MTAITPKRYARLWQARSTALVLLVFALVGCATSRGQLVHGVTDARVSEYVTNAENAEARFEFKEAIVWYKKASALGDAKSMNALGWIYFGAHDVPGRHLTDYPEASFWFEKAAALHYAPAVAQLGAMYNGDGSFGVPADHVKASELFLEAAEAGDAGAMDNLGVAYFQGKGLPKNIDLAKHWWHRAVEVDKNGGGGQAAQSWLDLLDGKGFFPDRRAATR